MEVDIVYIFLGILIGILLIDFFSKQSYIIFKYPLPNQTFIDSKGTYKYNFIPLH